MGAGANARAGCASDLLHNQLAIGLIDATSCGEELLQLIGNNLADNLGSSSGSKDLLGLAFELRLRHTNCHYSCNTLHHVIFDDICLILLQDTSATHRLIKCFSDGAFKSLKVCSALRSCNDVDERSDRGVKASSPLHCDINFHIALYLGRDHMSLIVENWNSLLIMASSIDANDIANRLIRLEEITVLRDSTFVIESLSRLLFCPVVVNS